MTDPRYPVGKYDPADATPLAEAIETIRQLPFQVRDEVSGATDAGLDTPYRDGGWTARQVVHHLADSHLNSVLRFRMALTENRPAVMEYDEKKWAELPDARSGGVETSLQLLDGLHARWAALLEALTSDQWKRVFIHPKRGDISVETGTRLYAWHCRHHLAHIRIALGGKGK